MAQVDVAAADIAAPVKSSGRVLADRLFYPASAVLMLVLTLVGFHHFFFHGRAFPGRPLTPPIRTLLIVHGVGQLMWVLLFIVQPTLIAMRKRKLHRLLGPFGAALAGVLVVLGYMVAVKAAHVNPPDLVLLGLHPPEFLHVPLSAIGVFGLFVGLAIWQRRRPAVHRALMFTATLSVLSAAMGRINWINDMVAGTMWYDVFGPLQSSVMLGVVLLAVRCVVIRRFDRWLAISIGAMALVFAAMFHISGTAAWHHFAMMLIG